MGFLEVFFSATFLAGSNEFVFLLRAIYPIKFVGHGKGFYSSWSLFGGPIEVEFVTCFSLVSCSTGSNPKEVDLNVVYAEVSYQMF